MNEPDWDELRSSEPPDDATADTALAVLDNVTPMRRFLAAAPVAATAPEAPESPRPAPGQSGRPVLVMPGGAVSITTAARGLFEVLKKSGQVFLRGKAVTTLQRDSSGAVMLEPIQPSPARSLFETFIEPWAWRAGRGGEPVLKRTVIPLETARALLDCHVATELLPPVAGLANCPLITEIDGQLLVAGKGYSRETEMLIQRGDEPPLVPLAEAVAAIRGLLAEFQFQTPGDESRALASFITPALKMGRLIEGYCPIDVAEADKSQSGKTYRQRMVAAVYGEQPMMVTLKKGGVGSVDESFFTKLVGGRPFIQFDNFRGLMDSPALEAFMTAENSFSCRLPHQREIEVDPRRFNIALSSNGVESTRDLANRSSIIRIFKREGVEFVDTLGRIREQQPYYLGCVFAVIREWHRQGKQRTADTRHDFREWAQTLDWIVQGIFDGAPIMDGHLAAQERVSNPTLTFVRVLGIAIQQTERLGEALSASQIYEIADENEIAIPGLKDANRADEGAARKVIGVKMGALFRKSDTLEVDGFSVKRQEEQRDRDGGTYVAKTYIFFRTTAQVAQGGPNF